MTAIMLHVVLVAAGALLFSLALAPMESLGWWAGWLGPDRDDEPAHPPACDDAGDAPPRCFVVFLSGIGSISGDELLPQESAFLDRLQAELPEARIVRDVFPYAPSGRQLLTGQRVFTWLWRRVLDWRLNGTRLLPAILNFRNLFQVLVSADHRYGPLYSFGIARVVRERLEAHGYPEGSDIPVVLVGSSGGGQISVGAATYLGADLDAPLAIVTFGGVMSSDRGIEDVARLVSLYGARDDVYALGRTAFPGRWSVATGSFWNVARTEGRLVEHRIGAMGHSGRGGYLDASPPADGSPSFFDLTATAVAGAVRQELKVRALAAAEAKASDPRPG